jgi:hypothetical protein
MCYEVRKGGEEKDVVVRVDDQTLMLKAQHILVATGRRANTENLGLEKARRLRLPKTFHISSYLTFVRGGYIMRIRPMAIGIEVVPILNEPMMVATPG